MSAQFQYCFICTEGSDITYICESCWNDYHFKCLRCRETKLNHGEEVFNDELCMACYNASLLQCGCFEECMCISVYPTLPLPTLHGLPPIQGHVHATDPIPQIVPIPADMVLVEQSPPVSTLFADTEEPPNQTQSTLFADEEEPQIPTHHQMI